MRYGAGHLDRTVAERTNRRLASLEARVRKIEHSGQAPTAAARGHAETITGDGVETDFVITHDLSSRDLVVVVRENSGSYAQIEPADYNLEYTSLDTVTVKFAAALGSSVERRVIVRSVL